MLKVGNFILGYSGYSLRQYTFSLTSVFGQLTVCCGSRKKRTTLVLRRLTMLLGFYLRDKLYLVLLVYAVSHKPYKVII